MVNQGCLLSPLLFVIAVDGLIRYLHRASPNTFVRMYADDTAVVLQDIRKEAPKLYKVLQDLGFAANIWLNVRKCLFIPLFQQDEENAQELLRSVTPEFADMQCATSGKYLGYYVGPGKGHQSWHKVLRKAAERVALWNWSTLGPSSALSPGMFSFRP